MLARTQIRRFAVAALKDETQPFGPRCDCLGPIAKDCDGRAVEINDSATGYIGDRISSANSGDIGLPFIAVYVEETGSEFSAGHLGSKTTVNFTLTIEIYETGTSDWEAEDRLDELQKRILFRLLRESPVIADGCEYRPLHIWQPTSMRTRTERENNDRRIFVRQIEISLTGCDSFEAPECKTGPCFCATVTTPADC